MQFSMGEKTKSRLIVAIACGLFNKGAKRIELMMTKNFQPPTDEEIAHYAYCLWESEGRIHGRDLDYWLQAKAHLTAAREHEAGLLNAVQPKESTVKKSPTVTASATASFATKPTRRRQSRSVREVEAVCA
jgi:hypothetical protein